MTASVVPPIGVQHRPSIRDFAAPGQAVSAQLVAIGTALALISYGHICHASCQYFMRYRKDGIHLKGVIAFLFILATLHVVFTVMTCQVVVVEGRDIQTMTVWTFEALTPLTGLMVMTSYGFFARRVWRLCGPSIVFLALSALGALVCSTLVLVSTVYAYRPEAQYASFPFSVVLSIAAILMVANNTYMTVKLVLYLKRSRTGFKSTDTLLDKLITFSVNTGLLMGIVTAAGAGLALGLQSYAYYPLASLLLPLHASVVLTAVNSRRSLVDRGSDGIELKSFDMDFAVPRRGHTNPTIQWARPSMHEEEG